MSVVGIDFGNVNTVVAVARNRGIDIILNDTSNRFTPSLVSFGEKQRWLGEAAKTQEVSNFKNTVSSLKRLIGRPFSDSDIDAYERKYINSNLVEGERGEVAASVMYQNESSEFTFTQISAMFLGKVRDFTAKELKLPVKDVVVSVPGWFTDRQRRAILDASEVAGLAALGYGITKLDLPDSSVDANVKPRIVVFVDLGHTSYQVSVVSFVKGKLVVKGTAFDRNLGGRDFDELLLEHFVKEFDAKYKMDIKSNKKATYRLRMAIEKVKKVLSANAVTVLGVECLLDDKDVSARIERSQFQEYSVPLVERLIPPLQQALSAAGLTVNDIDSVELIGGSTRIPAVKEALANFFGGSLEGENKLSTTLNQDEAVARGCALMCAIISPIFKVRDFSITEWNGYPVVLKWDPSVIAVKAGEDIESTTDIFPVGNVIPTTKALTLNRVLTEADIATKGGVVFGISAEYDVNASVARQFPEGTGAGIGQFILKGIKKTVPKAGEEVINSTIESTGVEKASLRIKIKLDQSGIFAVESAHQVEELLVQVKEDPPKDSKDKPAPMETDDATAKETPTTPPVASPETVAEKKTKKVTRKHELEVLSQTWSVPSDLLSKWFSLEGDMTSSDRLIIDTAEKRNALEEYVYYARDKLDMAWSEFITDADRSVFQKELSTMEDWLYSEEGEDATKSLYAEKLAFLKKSGDPVAQRYLENEERPRAEKALRDYINNILVSLSSGDDRYAHIPKADLDKVAADCQAKLNWLNDSIAKQNETSKHAPVVVTVAQIAAEQNVLNILVNPVLTRPKPKPAPPKKEDETKPAEDANMADADKKDKDEKEAKEEMDVD
ncbi:adenyl-nucleotide exchange factor sse1 [Nowakowskiella sp. JEL0078]|nr:adenyl-nucleotide exchange factor sse1 [Nowakowskiella sp. JEL0078]